MSYKLYYFDARGVAEPIRWLLAVGDIEYEDIRSPMTFPPVLIPEIKEKGTWGQVPVLEMDGKRLCQSLAITRYFANKLGLVGKDDFEAAQCDECVDSTLELTKTTVPIFYEKDQTKIPEMRENFTKTGREKYLDKFESILESNGTGWLVGNSFSWADLYLVHAMTNIKLILDIDLITKDHPCLQKLVDKVVGNPKIKAWMEKRPKTKF